LAAVLGRGAVDQRMRGRGYGELLPVGGDDDTFDAGRGAVLR
jgi:hypothetical protein